MDTDSLCRRGQPSPPKRSKLVLQALASGAVLVLCALLVSLVIWREGVAPGQAFNGGLMLVIGGGVIAAFFLCINVLQLIARFRSSR